MILFSIIFLIKITSQIDIADTQVGTRFAASNTPITPATNSLV